MKNAPLLALAAVLAVAAPAAAQAKLNGAGATFPNIIYQDWMLTTRWMRCTVPCSASCSRT